MQSRRPVLYVRRGRGRTGGSTGLDWLIQRARRQGRRVKALDGDMRSQTLSRLHPPADDGGRPLPDATTSPRSEAISDMRVWLNAELDAMVEEREVSRVLDLGGGERVIAEFVRDLSLPAFCREFGIRLVQAYYLGPDPEDLQHVVQVVRAGDLSGSDLLLVLNEGVVQQGQSTESAFAPILADPSFVALVESGARAVFMRRLSCLHILREKRLGFYEIMANERGPDGCRRSPVLVHMTSLWANELEAQHRSRDVLEWLP
jgi:hypothetical protein